MVPVMSEEAAVRHEVVPMNILIVDDEMSIRETCATVSEQCGMKAVAVATADEALQVLEHSAIDILLTDLKLQQSSGVDLLKQVRRKSVGTLQGRYGRHSRRVSRTSDTYRPSCGSRGSRTP
ncbi:MAG TPA: response regulator [Candidatus Acidoferrum sp.]